MKKTTMIYALVLALGMFFLIPAQAENFRNEKQEIDLPPQFVPCTGESIEVDGFLHIVVSGNIANGIIANLKLHANGQGVRGIGSTGTIYHGNGILNHTIKEPFVGFPLVVHGVEMKINLIGKGQASNYKINVILDLAIISLNQIDFDIVNLICNG